ncbi:hypothetical protein MMYC01_209287 [Madurella mycetomatis]|uniref:HD domain-containing protein n=1 Tax=Madurella mycetomatis TaxID=100816 RepID=A0A175VU91_9PEZI|nr:hypothetical protein MMYC01_209287 [Madurella mycetomatis]
MMLGFARVLSLAAMITLLPSLTLAAEGGIGERVRRPYRLRTIAGVSVVDTPLIRAAEMFARQHGDDFTYNHIMRSWLLGTLLIQHNETLRETIDLEVHAIATILHDLGWDRSANSSFVSPDRRFEVDGAIAARDFIRSHKDGKKWDARRLQLVWDAIALHTEPKIALFKELEVQAVNVGIALDFGIPAPGVTDEEYAAIAQEFPKDDFKSRFNETMIWLCQTKPTSTYGESN